MSSVQQPEPPTATSYRRPPDAAGVERWLVATSLAFTTLLAAWAIAALFTKGGLDGLDAALVGTYERLGPDGRLAPAGRLEGISRDITGLGSNTVLAMITIFAAILLAKLGRAGAAAFLFTTAASGLVFNSLVKMLFARTRPELSSLTVVTETTSFPSSHAMLSAIVFLALAAVVAREMENRGAAIVVLVAAIAATVLVGLTRLHLGIHWPSDVLTGWVLGAAWVLAAIRMTRAPRPPGG